MAAAVTLIDVPDTAPLDFKRDRWGRPLIVPADGGLLGEWQRR